MKNQPADRQHYVDWLRVGAMFLLLFYHTGRLFDKVPWHIKNAVLNQGIEIFNRFLDIWHMPLFFLLAGASVWFALGHRTPGAFTRERILRIFVPLVFGMLIIIPPQVYTQRIFDGDFAGSFLAWYPHTFQGTYSMSDPSSGNLSWHHLWFLAYLFVFSLLLIPAFWYFKNDKRKSLLSKLGDFLAKPGALFLPAVPLIIVNITLRPIFGWGTQNLISDWANFLFYILIFFYGFLMVSDKRVLLTIQHNKTLSLIVAAVVSFFIYLIKVDILVLPSAYTIYLTAAAIACWYWLMALIGFGSLLFNVSNAVLKYASDAVLPVYILHQTIIVTLGYFVIQLNTGVAPKYFLMVLATLAISLGIYEIVRRIKLTRFLFGIKIKKTTFTQAATAEIPPVS
jgi:glucans biosynthesis protein C